MSIKINWFVLTKVNLFFLSGSALPTSFSSQNFNNNGLSQEDYVSNIKMFHLWKTTEDLTVSRCFDVWSLKVKLDSAVNNWTVSPMRTLTSLPPLWSWWGISLNKDSALVSQGGSRNTIQVF